MKKTVNINIRVDENLKTDADILFKKLGLNISSAINMFLTQSVREQALPFTPSINYELNDELNSSIDESVYFLNSKSNSEKSNNGE